MGEREKVRGQGERERERDMERKRERKREKKKTCVLAGVGGHYSITCQCGLHSEQMDDKQEEKEGRDGGMVEGKVEE